MKKKEILTTAVVFLQKSATAVADVLWLVLLAELIKEPAMKGSSVEHIWRKIPYLMGLILLTVWKRMGYSLGRSLTLKLQNRVRFRQFCKMVEKAARIPYRLLEDHAFFQLKYNLEKNIQGRFVWHVIQNFSNSWLYGIKTLGVCILLGWFSPLLGCLFFLMHICHILLIVLEEQQENADERMDKENAKISYLKELALGYESVGNEVCSPM